MKYLHSFKNFLNESKVSKDKDHEITQAGNIWVLVYKIKHKTFKHHFGSEKEAEEFWNSKKENLREGKTDNVINEDFPGPGETVLAKDITPSVLDYFDRTNKKLLIDTKTKKGIKGEVGRMYNDLVFNGDTIQLKDIIQVKILESTNEEFVNEARDDFREMEGNDTLNEIENAEDFSDLVYKDMWNDLLAWAKSNRTSSRKNAKYPSESKQEAYLLSIAPKYQVDVNILKKTLKQYDDLHNRTYGMIPGGLTWQEWVDAKINK